MHSHLFKAAVLALSLTAVPALAQQSPHANGWPGSNLAAPFEPSYGGPALPSGSSQSAHNAIPNFGVDYSAPVTTVEMAPQRGTNGPIDTANSVPPGFYVGAPGYAYQQSVHQWFASHGMLGPYATGAAGRAVDATSGRGR